MNLEYKKINKGQIINSIIIGIFINVVVTIMVEFNLIYVSLVILFQLDYILPFYLFDRKSGKGIIYLSAIIFVLIELLLIYFALYQLVSPIYVVYLVIAVMALFKIVTFYTTLKIPSFVIDKKVDIELQKLYMKKFLRNTGIFLGIILITALLISLII